MSKPIFYHLPVKGVLITIQFISANLGLKCCLGHIITSLYHTWTRVTMLDVAMDMRHTEPRHGTR